MLDTLNSFFKHDYFLLFLGLMTGSAMTYTLMSRVMSKLKQRLLRSDLRLALELEQREKDLQNKEDVSQAFRDSFSALSGQALRENNESFLKLAQENLSKQQQVAQSRINPSKN